MSISNTSLPGGSSGVNGDDVTALFGAIASVEVEASRGAPRGVPINSPDPNWVAKRVWNIRYDKTFNQDQKNRIIYNFIWGYESSRTRVGCAWLRVGESKRPYLHVYNPQHPRLLEIDSDNLEFTGYLWDTYGLTHSETVTKHLINMLRNGTSSKGLSRDERRFSHWDRHTKTLYISSYDGYCRQITGQAIDQSGVTSVPNGTGAALFVDDDRGVPLVEPVIGNNRALFKGLIEDLQYAPTTSGGMSPEIQRTCLSIWIFAIAFPDLMATKPILLVEGEPGSGKTTAIQRIALALHGKYAALQVRKQEDPDFGVTILRSPIAILDDINEPVTWLRDALCTYATGGAWTRRALYTNDAEHVIKPESFLAITTNNPATFRQTQLADRCLIIRLERRKDNVGPEALFAQTRADRDVIVGDWLTWLNEIVAELRKDTKPAPTRHRLADFAHLAHVIGRVLAKPGGPSGDWSPDAIDAMLDAMAGERAALVTEGDCLVDLLDRWLNRPSNVGRDVLAAELHADLATLGGLTNTAYTYRSAKALAARLRSIGPALAEHFVIERVPTGHANTLAYRIRRRVI